MAKAKLNKRAVDAAAATGKTYVIYDTDLPGFGLRVTAAGAKSWIVEYRPGSGGRGVAKRRYAFGSAKVLTADEARRAARDLLQKIGQGADPLESRTAERNGSTVAELSAAFMQDHVRAKRKAGTATLYQDYLDRLVLPTLGTKKVNGVTRGDVARLHNSLRDTPVTANRVLAVMASMYSWGKTHGYVDEAVSPTSRIEKFAERSRERFLGVDELERLGATLSLAETGGLPWDVDEDKPKAKHLAGPANRRTVLSPYATAAVRLLILTGCRLREILHLRWTEVDFERGMLHLADSKTGRKSVVLNAPALHVIEGLPRAGEYVILGATPSRPRADLKKPWNAIRAHAALAELRIHDLRHSFASVGAGAGLGLPIVGKLLGHKQTATTQRYAHLDNDPLRRASNAIGETINAAMTGKRSGEVVELSLKRGKA